MSVLHASIYYFFNLLLLAKTVRKLLHRLASSRKRYRAQVREVLRRVRLITADVDRV